MIAYLVVLGDRIQVLNRWKIYPSPSQEVVSLASH